MTLTKSLGGGSASSATQSIWDPDKPPTSANSLDVELTGSSSLSAWPGAWTVAAAGTFDSAVYPGTTPGWLSMRMTGSAWRGYRVAIPAGDFNIACCAGAFGLDSDFSLVGLGMNASTTIDANSSTWVEVGRRTSWGVRYNTLSNVGAFSTPKTHPTHRAHREGVIMFARLSGSTYTVGWSIDGRVSHEFTVTPPVTPTTFHVAAFSSSAAESMEFIKWVRYLPSGTATTYGGSRVLLAQ